MKKYFIKEDYTHRLDNLYFDDTLLADEWQKEVYEFAKLICVKHDIKNIADIGTGSGYKLLQYFSEYHTLGIDVTETINWLQKQYPNKLWSDKFEPVNGYELIIASDVIEHLPDPDTLLYLIEKSNPKFIIFSTPDRDLQGKMLNGPPKNRHHCREWSMDEFNNYINSRFEVLDHFISNEQQATQVILAKLR
jgi:2-polyprenyl-3-methyl-5-hydroxy-6-metoxy-1,4-benzoquinol methylase